MFASLPTSWVAIVMATSALAAPYAKTDFSVDQNVTDFDLIARATGPNVSHSAIFDTISTTAETDCLLVWLQLRWSLGFYR